MQHKTGGAELVKTSTTFKQSGLVHLDRAGERVGFHVAATQGEQDFSLNRRRVEVERVGVVRLFVGRDHVASFIRAGPA